MFTLCSVAIHERFIRSTIGRGDRLEVMALFTHLQRTESVLDGLLSLIVPVSCIVTLTLANVGYSSRCDKLQSHSFLYQNLFSSNLQKFSPTQ